VAAPVGLDREQVLDAAVALLRQHGRVADVTLGELAKRVGVRTQSLYAHVDGLDGLRRELAVRAQAALADRLEAAPPTVDGIVRAYFAFADDEPGLYDASLRPPGDDPAMLEATARVTAPLNGVLAAFGLDASAQVHWYRVIFAGVHGLSVLHRDGLLTLPGSAEDSLGRMIRAVVHELEREAG
jgi:AcrR family transcriptional regulator